MKPAKYSKKNTIKIDLGEKTIYKYPTPTKKFDIARMVVRGRHPKGKNKYIIEKECSFVMYVLKGSGKYFVGKEIFIVKKDDVVFVPKKHKFACEGNFEYITVDVPAFYLEQSEEVEVK